MTRTAEETLEELARVRVIAVVRVRRRRETRPLIEALLAGGIRAIELTWTSPEPAAEIAAARDLHGDGLLLGAGTLRGPSDVSDAVGAGADFLVTPHFEPGLWRRMSETGRLALPGVFTPSEVAAALDAGADAVKLFPGSTGGIGHLKALLGPFPDLTVVPTGGVSAANAADWLAAGALAVGAGGELCARELLEAGDWAEVERRASRLVEAASSVGAP